MHKHFYTTHTPIQKAVDKGFLSVLMILVTDEKGFYINMRNVLVIIRMPFENCRSERPERLRIRPLELGLILYNIEVQSYEN